MAEPSGVSVLSLVTDARGSMDAALVALHAGPAPVSEALLAEAHFLMHQLGAFWLRVERWEAEGL